MPAYWIMTNPRLATRYAKSLIGLAQEKNVLEAVIADMKFFSSLQKTNPDFTALLRSPIINADKKEKIINAITGNKVSELSNLFISLLVRKGREGNLPEIAEAFITQYNTLKGIHKVKLTTAAPLSQQIQQEIMAKIKTESGVKNIELETGVDHELVGGFTLQMADIYVDASILRDLNDIKKQFLNNEYIHQLR